jgi:hypothetical protein
MLTTALRERDEARLALTKQVRATWEAAAQIADEIGRIYAEKDDSGTAVPTDETCAAVACAVTIAAGIRARAGKAAP